MKRQNGITLVALVVTIVVLLILAGITLSLLLGENGIISKSKYTKEEQRRVSLIEQIDMWKTDREMDSYLGTNKAQGLEDLLNNLVSSGLISNEEKNNIKSTGYLTINGKDIIFLKYGSMIGRNTESLMWDNSDIITEIYFENMIPDNISTTDKWDVSKEKNESVIAWLDGTKLYIAQDGGIILSSGNQLFQDFSNLTTINGLDKVNTSQVTDMSYMFKKCSLLQNLDLSNFDTSNVTKMNGMFSYCEKLENIDLKNLDTANVNNMSAMFYNCSSIQNLDLSNFITSNVTTMEYMFDGCSSLKTLNLNSFDTPKVTTMKNMFVRCSSLQILDVSNFDTSNVKNMNYMFASCSKLQSIILGEKFTTAKVTDMSYMFAACAFIKELDLSRFDTSSVTSMSYMFKECSSLQTLNLSNFTTTRVTDMVSMFDRCYALNTLQLQNFNINDTATTDNMFYRVNKSVKIITNADMATWLNGHYTDYTNIETV